MQYREGALRQKEYVAHKLQQENRVRELQNRQAELLDRQKVLQKAGEKYLRAVKSLLKLKSGKELTTQIINDLIERIYVYPGKRIEIQFRYTNEILEGVI